MDYSIVLNEISNHQVDLLSALRGLQNGLDCLILVFSIFALGVYLRLIIKH